MALFTYSPVYRRILIAYQPDGRSLHNTGLLLCVNKIFFQSEIFEDIQTLRLKYGSSYRRDTHYEEE